jgi:hypothetical protein
MAFSTRILELVKHEIDEFYAAQPSLPPGIVAKKEKLAER